LGVPYLSCSSRDETRVGVLDGDQLHVRHGDEVAEVGSVIERVPVIYLDRGDANGHGVLVGGCAFSLWRSAPYCVNLRQLWKQIGHSQTGRFG